MIIGRERVFYLGLLGVPSERALGASILYSSLSRPFNLCVDGVWQSRWLAMVPPYQAHRISTEDGLISAILLEPEAVDLGRVRDWIDCVSGDAQRARILAGRIRRAYGALHDHGGGTLPATWDLDRLFLGRPLPSPILDARVARVVRAMQADPRSLHTARDCAAGAGLSFSRFLHLFKRETGVSFRKFRAWKRARGVLYHVNRPHSMTEVALEAGYPDAAHFSRCVRQVYGLCPSDIFAGSRRLPILFQGLGIPGVPGPAPLTLRVVGKGV